MSKDTIPHYPASVADGFMGDRKQVGKWKRFLATLTYQSQERISQCSGVDFSLWLQVFDLWRDGLMQFTQLISCVTASALTANYDGASPNILAYYGTELK